MTTIKSARDFTIIHVRLFTVLLAGNVILLFISILIISHILIQSLLGFIFVLNLLLSILVPVSMGGLAARIVAQYTRHVEFKLTSISTLSDWQFTKLLLHR